MWSAPVTVHMRLSIGGSIKKPFATDEKPELVVAGRELKIDTERITPALDDLFDVWIWVVEIFEEEDLCKAGALLMMKGAIIFFMCAPDIWKCFPADPARAHAVHMRGMASH